MLLSLCLLAASGEPIAGIADAAADLLADALGMQAAVYMAGAGPARTDTTLRRIGRSHGQAASGMRPTIDVDHPLVRRAFAEAGPVVGRAADAGMCDSGFLVVSGCMEHGAPIGVVVLAGDARTAVRAVHARVLDKVLALVTHAISYELLREERSRMVSELEHLARRDALTGLANRRMLDEAAGQLLCRAGREGLPVAVAMLDMDHFKQWNDAQGHAAGDDLLVRTAAAWSTAVRSGDLLARYGGEEFALMLPGTGLAAANLVVHRLRALVPEGQTCSAGLVQWDGREDVSSVLERADAALYGAKRAGRDRTVVG